MTSWEDRAQCSSRGPAGAILLAPGLRCGYPNPPVPNASAYGSLGGVSAVAFDVTAARRRFSALDRDFAFFDGPGGSQVPDSVIDAIANHLRESNANTSGPYETSRRTEALITQARRTAGSFLCCGPDEVIFGANMSTLNFALTRSVARGWTAGDEVVVTRLDHDANVSPWLELAHDLGIVVHFAAIDDRCRVDLADLESKLSDRTRVVAFPWAANSVGTLTDAERICALAHDAGALAWVDAVHYAPHGPIDVAAIGADVLICSPYKYFGPHLGLAFGRAELLQRLRPYEVRPAPTEPVGARFETGTLPHELLAGFVASVDYVDSIGFEAIVAWEHELGERFLAGLPDRYRLYGAPTMEGRVPTFCFNHATLSAQHVAERLGEQGLFVWWGDYYAVEVMRQLGLGPDGAVRVGILHYNTPQEVDRLLAALDAL
jgi:cysteine desulfurase family protein (TIGR01976 family)